MSSTNKKKYRSIAGLAEKKGLYFLARRKPGGDLGGLWELPGGKLEEGETPFDAMKREWMGELEVQVETGVLLTTVSFSHHNKDFQLELYEVSFSDQKMTLNEHTETGWFTKDQVESLDLADSDRKALTEIWKEISPVS